MGLRDTQIEAPCRHPARELSRPILRDGKLICACFACMGEVEIKIVDRPIGRAVEKRIKDRLLSEEAS